MYKHRVHECMWYKLISYSSVVFPPWHSKASSGRAVPSTAKARWVSGLSSLRPSDGPRASEEVFCHVFMGKPWESLIIYGEIMVTSSWIWWKLRTSNFLDSMCGFGRWVSNGSMVKMSGRLVRQRHQSCLTPIHYRCLQMGLAQNGQCQLGIIRADVMWS